MWVRKRLVSTLTLTALALLDPSLAQAEVKIGESGGWALSTDGRVNAFVSHVYGDPRPDGLSLPWVGFNESTASGQVNADNKLQKTRVRSGYVPSTLAVNLRKQMFPDLKAVARVELGFQIANTAPTEIADPTWMEPRAVYLDLSGSWGSVRGGRDISLFGRGNLFMNYELGHAYGLGFPCAYEKVFGGACGHVGFGALWPDFRAQISYTTPSIGDIVSLSVGVFDPRTIPTYNWFQTPLPRFEGEANANYSWQEGWGVKAWVNGVHQRIGTTANIDPDNDPMTMNSVPTDFTQDAYGVGGGVVATLGPVKVGGSGYMGKGMDAFSVLSFNPIFLGQSSAVEAYERRFRPSKGFLAEASVTIGDTWFMGGFGQGLLDRVDTDTPITELGAVPLIRTQTGISAGVFHRLGQVVLGLDYFNASYGFDPNRIATGTTQDYDQVSQTVHIFNGGVTLEW